MCREEIDRECRDVEKVDGRFSFGPLGEGCLFLPASGCGSWRHEDDAALLDGREIGEGVFYVILRSSVW